MNLVKGSVLSEIQFYVVESVNGHDVVVKDENGNEINLTMEYVEEILNSADHFEKEEKVNMTDLAEIFLNNTRIAMTVCYRKKDEPKSAKAIKAEKDALKAKLHSANMIELQKLIDEFVDNPIQTVVQGDERVMKGRHYGKINSLGRNEFVDMEAENKKGTYDSRVKQVDTRTLKYVIVNKVKYILK